MSSKLIGTGKTVLVTGGAGFLGSYVVDRCMSEGYHVYVVDNLITGSLSNLLQHQAHPRFHFYNHDVQYDFPAEVAAVSFSLIFHMACIASPFHYQQHPIETTLTCVNGTYRALRLAHCSGCPLVLASTSEVYGEPQCSPQAESERGSVSCTGPRSCYDEGKRCAESLCFDFERRYGVEVRVARIFNAYGPRMGLGDGRAVSNFMAQALTGRPLTVYGSGRATRSFVHCRDLIDGLFRLARAPKVAGPVNLGRPVAHTVLEVAGLVREVCGSNSAVVFHEAAVDDPQQRCPDISKAQALLEWTPEIDLLHGLKETKAAFESQIKSRALRVKKIYIQCNPLLDVISHVDQAFLDKYGIHAPAELCREDQLPIYNEMSLKEGTLYAPGGSGLNTARVAQWMSQYPPYTFVTYVGSVSDDTHGNTMKYANNGLIMLLDMSSTKPTGTCATCIVDKERYLLANLAAANDLSSGHLQSKEVQHAMREADMLYFTGFTLTLNIGYVLDAARVALDGNRDFVFNLSAPFIIQCFGDQLDQVLPYCSTIIANSIEAEAFANRQGWGNIALPEIAKQVAHMPRITTRNRLVIFTNEASETHWAKSNNQCGSVPVKPIPKDKIVDTNGAGDAFVGGYFAALSNNQGLTDAIEAGHYAAGIIIQYNGCTFPADPNYTFLTQD